MRVSLTADPVEEPPCVGASFPPWGCAAAARLVSCPTCGRTQVDLIGLAERVSDRLKTCDKPISVAVMGCVVNGPGEASDADVGVACGRGWAWSFAMARSFARFPKPRSSTPSWRKSTSSSPSQRLAPDIIPSGVLRVPLTETPYGNMSGTRLRRHRPFGVGQPG